MRMELFLLGALILMLNLPMLVGGGNSGSLALDFGAVRAGEWWRVATCSLVHVSWYHLLLDAGAFLFLYGSLPLERRWQRLLMVISTAVGSLAAVCFASPLTAQFGFCGLSGIDHGLMAIASLEMIARRKPDAFPTMDAISLAGLSGKCAIEAITGQALFASWHLGSVGTPIVISHLGGLLGGALGWVALRAFHLTRSAMAQPNCPC